MIFPGHTVCVFSKRFQGQNRCLTPSLKGVLERFLEIFIFFKDNFIKTIFVIITRKIYSENSNNQCTYKEYC
jgi:hypothetical protein